MNEPTPATGLPPQADTQAIDILEDTIQQQIAANAALTDGLRQLRDGLVQLEMKTIRDLENDSRHEHDPHMGERLDAHRMILRGIQDSMDAYLHLKLMEIERLRETTQRLARMRQDAGAALATAEPPVIIAP